MVYQTLHSAVCSALWEEPQDLVSLLAMLSEAASQDPELATGLGSDRRGTAAQAKEALQTLIAQGTVGAKRGFFFLTAHGRSSLNLETEAETFLEEALYAN